MEEIGHVYVPAHIMSRKDMSILEKVLFGKIVGLSGAEGYCFASNKWIGDQLGQSERTISRWIGKLIKLGVVNRELVYNERKEIIKRKLFPIWKENELWEGTHLENEQDIVGGGTKSVYRGGTKSGVGIQENYIQEIRVIPKKEKTSKNSHTPCTDEQLQQIAIDLQVPFSSVSNKHAEIMDKVQDGSFSKYGKTVYYTLRNWVRIGLREGKIHKTQEAQIKEMYGLS